MPPIRCRLLIDPPADGAWNMGLDEALLEHAASSGDDIWLRFYQWREPTLSLGYFQSSDAWRKHVAGACPMVRRQSGGGAILHDRELTYSLFLPKLHSATQDPEAVYAIVHHALIEALGEFGIHAHRYGELETQGERGSEAFLCFERRAASDVVVRRPTASGGPLHAGKPSGPAATLQADVKICGSAQRRRQGAVLMHGSLLLAASDIAPQLPGIKEVTGIDVSLAEIRVAWSNRLTAAIGAGRPDVASLPPKVHIAASKFAENKYRQAAWNGKR